MSGWETVALEKVADIERDSVAASDIRDGTFYVGLENIQSGGTFLDVRAVDGGELASSKFAFTEEHLLYGKLRPYLAKIARPTFAGVCSTDILPIKPGPLLDRDYLSHFLRQPGMVDFANSRATGANLPRLSPRVLANFEIPLPPLPEQRRIAAILDQADTLRTQRRAALAQLDSLTQSLFLDMFGDPARNTLSLPTAALGDLGDWHSGGTPPRGSQHFFEGDIPWFSSGELESMYVSDSAEHISADAIRQTSAKLVPAGSLMLGMYDTAALKASIATRDGSCNQAIAFSKIRSDRAHPIYVYFAIVVGREHFKRLQRGVRQKNLNLSMVREIRIPSPPLPLQQTFATRVQAIEALKAQHRAALAEADALFASLQQRAFAGTL